MDFSDHLPWMNLAFEQAGLPLKRTLPNPRVGAVVVKDDKVVGSGYHDGPGTLHAEDMALRNAGPAAEGADLYCTLEPCSTVYPGKRRPPCTEAVIRSGVKRVFIANVDPNPYVNGKGIALLKKAGIDVFTGLSADRGECLNRDFFFSMRNKRPFVTLKAALTLDGRIAASDGGSKWITDIRARELVHGQRASCDGILVGSGTVNADDPSLTVRMDDGIDPLRIILSRRLNLDPNRRLFTSGLASGTVVYTETGPDENPVGKKLISNGVDVRKVETSGGKNFLQAVLSDLHGLSIRSVLVEGGCGIHTAFLRQNLYECISLYYAPKILGSGRFFCGDLDRRKMDDVLKLESPEVYDIGQGQVRIQGYRSGYLQQIEEVRCSQA